MHWNHRVIEFETEGDGKYWEIHEVYYEDGLPAAYAEGPAAVRWFAQDSNPGPEWILAQMKKATEAPILKASDFKGFKDEDELDDEDNEGKPCV